MGRSSHNTGRLGGSKDPAARRVLLLLRHTVRLMPPAYVKPYVKRQKNDAADTRSVHLLIFY